MGKGRCRPTEIKTMPTHCSNIPQPIHLNFNNSRFAQRPSLSYRNNFKANNGENFGLARSSFLLRIFLSQRAAALLFGEDTNYLRFFYTCAKTRGGDLVRSHKPWLHAASLYFYFFYRKMRPRVRDNVTTLIVDFSSSTGCAAT